MKFSNFEEFWHKPKHGWLKPQISKEARSTSLIMIMIWLMLDKVALKPNSFPSPEQNFCLKPNYASLNQTITLFDLKRDDQLTLEEIGDPIT